VSDGVRDEQRADADDERISVPSRASPPNRTRTRPTNIVPRPSPWAAWRWPSTGSGVPSAATAAWSTTLVPSAVIGSIGTMIAMPMYSSRPRPPKKIDTNQSRRTSVGSSSKYSARPPATPARTRFSRQR